MKLALDRVGVCCWGEGGDGDDAWISEERVVVVELEGDCRVIAGSKGADAGHGERVVSVGFDATVFDAVAFDSATFDEEGGGGALLLDESRDGGSSGKSRIGTDSRYGRISGSMLAESSRFFHREGVRDGEEARREIGNGWPGEARGGEFDLGTEVV